MFSVDESDIIKSLNGAVISKKRHILDCTDTHPFSLSALLSSNCYDKETLKRLKTKSVIQEGCLVWFYEPNQNNKIGAIALQNVLKMERFIVRNAW